MTDEEMLIDQPEVKDEAGSEEAKALAKLKEAIEVEREEVGPLRLKLTVTVPFETVAERKSEQFQELRRDALIPGFRKGHAPIELVEKRFGTDVGEQLSTQLFSNGFLAAVEKEDLKPLGDPLFWTKVTENKVGTDEWTREKVETDRLLPLNEALNHFVLPKEGPLTFSCEIDLKPEFELPALEGIPVKKPKVAITDQDVEVELKRMRMYEGTFKPVEDGVVEDDDLIYSDVVMTVDGQTIKQEENFDVAARDIRVFGIPLVGFGEVIVGKRVGDVVSFEAGVPADYENITVREKTARFEFMLREIKRLDLPPLNEVFLKSIGFENEEELKDFVRSRSESQLDQTIREAMREQVGQYLVKNTKLELPEGLSQRQTERMIARRMVEMYENGVPEPELKKNLDELRVKAREQVQRDLKLYFIVEKIAEDQDVDVTEEELNDAIAEIATRAYKRFDRVRDELSRGNGLSSLYIHLRDRKVLDSLLEQAKITESEGPEPDKETKETAEKTSSNEDH